MKKGFTLIELLAVIIILAVIATVATPIVLDVVDNVRDEANKESAYGIIDAGRNYYAESMLSEDKNQKIKNFENIYNEVSISGERPEEGELYVNDKGQVAISVEFGNKCYVKEFYGELQELDTEECKVGYVGIDEINPAVTFNITGTKGENDWYIDLTTVDITVTDNETGISYFNWCSFKKVEGEECNLDNKVNGLNKTIVMEDTKGGIVCVEAFDKKGNSSGVICTDLIKVDQKAPTAGTIEIEQTEGNNGWYKEDVTIEVVEGSDSLSGHDSTTSNVTSITENTNGTIVTITTTDKAGHTSTRDYTIKLDKTLPTVNITEPSVDGLNGWYISKPTITITANDTISTFDKLKWCQGIDCEPTEEITESIKEITIEDTTGTQICVLAYDKAGNETEKTCSNTIKVDTVDPAFSGIADITVSKNAIVDLITGVTVSDTTSEIDGTFKTLNEDGEEITTIDTSKAGEYKVIYKVTDKAGREKEVTRKVIVSADAPSITYTPASGAINSNGWAKEDFIVTINVSDNSGHGIKSFNVCTATTDTCEPSSGSTITDTTTASREIVQESNNNRICVQATDGYGQTSSVVCSDAYKLDKTAPTAGTIKVNGSSTIASWYTSDVTITAVDGSDALSQHALTTVNTTSITSNTSGTTVTVTTTDKAGNESTRDYTIKVDKSQPTCTFTTLSYVGVNKTATIAVTCTNTVSKMSDKTLTASDFTVSNSNATITGVSKSSVTNGYRYTLTVKGVTAGTSTITLPASKVTTVAGLGNTAKTSESITVTNVSLSSTSGTGYVGGSNLTATITNTNAGTLSCSSSSTSIATCSISGSTLTVMPVGNGTATITVTGANGSPTATYTATSKVVTLGLSETSGTTYIGGSNLTATITSSNAGMLSCTTSNSSYATCTINGTTLTITPGNVEGTATITVKESNANKTITYTATIEQGYTCSTGTLTSDSIKGSSSGGYVCVISADVNYNCSSYGYVEYCETCTETTTTEPSYYCKNYIEGSGTSAGGIEDCAHAGVTCSVGSYSGGACVVTTTYECNCSNNWTLLNTYTSSYDQTGGNTSCSANYYCSTNWETYSGSGASLKCYQVAQKK